jgi:hypothetical protein
MHFTKKIQTLSCNMFFLHNYSIRFGINVKHFENSALPNYHPISFFIYAYNKLQHIFHISLFVHQIKEM